MSTSAAGGIGTGHVNIRSTTRSSKSQKVGRTRSGIPWPLGAALLVALLASLALNGWLLSGKSFTPRSLFANGSNVDAGSSQPASPTSTNQDEPFKPASGKPSKVTFVVTWKYNDFVGSKPDTGAFVILVPKGRKLLKASSLFPDVVLKGLDEKYLDDNGVLYAKVGGTAKAVFNKVPPGEYDVFLKSKNTRNAAEKGGPDQKLLEHTFPAETAKFMLMNKVDFQHITVGEGEDLEFEHDFGITDF